MSLTKHAMGAVALGFLLSEVDLLSREVVTIKTGSGVLEPGTVLGQLDADDKFVPANDSVSADGSQTAVAVLAYGVDATSADVEAVVIRRLAAVKRPQLIFAGTIDSPAKEATAITQLAASHVIAR